MIVLEQLSKRYRETIAVDGISLRIGRGECVFLVGGSGCGKTTTLKMINRLVEPDRGRVWIDGCDHRSTPPHELRRRIGYGFQQVGLFPHLTVGENIAITPDLLGWPAARQRARAAELLEMVELPPGEFASRATSALSGGQRQRVGLARALAAEPEVLLLDEPFGALDPLTRDRLQRRFQEIRTRLGLTVVFVSHDMSEALLLADRIAVMHEGRLLQVGTPRELLTAPSHPAVAELLAMPKRQSEVVDGLLGIRA